MKLKLVKFVVLFFVLSVLLSGTAYAWEQGKLKINPSCKYEQRYDSNIFYERDDPDHDWISITTPGIAGEFGFGTEAKHKVSVAYKVELAAFYRFHDQNYGNHDLDSKIHLDFDKITLDASNNFKFTSSRAGTEFQRRNLRKEDTVNIVLGWHFNKFDIETGYRFFVVDYLSDTLEALDRYENGGWITGYYQIAPKTKALLEADYDNIQYWNTGGRNGNAYAILTGLKGEITKKIEGTVKLGYKSKLYSSSSANDFYGFAARVDLFYDMNEKVDMSLSYYSEPYESVYTNSNYYYGNHLIYNLTYKLGKDFTGILDMFWFHNNYPSPGIGETKKRVDDEFEIAPRLEYAWKEYLIFGIGYKFHQRWSNIHSRGYTQHVMNADVKLVF